MPDANPQPPAATDNPVDEIIGWRAAVLHGEAYALPSRARQEIEIQQFPTRSEAWAWVESRRCSGGSPDEFAASITPFTRDTGDTDE